MHKIISEDNFIWQEAELIMYLYDCMYNNKEIQLYFHLEGPCAETNGLYQTLDLFCNKNAYPKEKITIKTGNVIEQHLQYKIKKNYEYWYEVKLIQQWINKNKIDYFLNPSKHFGNFVGRSTWARLWVSSHLHTNFKNKTLQTFHSGLQKNYVVPDSDGLHDIIGLDNLNRYGCDSWNQITDFLQSCPILLDNDYDATGAYIAPSNKNYPIQYPANMNILNQYKNFCIDIVAETRVDGNLFFVTEKTWRPIIARRPFIVIGARNFLKNLKKLGFVTFNDFWDEGYDEYDSGNRVKHIIRLIDSIGSMPLAEIKKIVVSMDSILEHNYNVFMKLTYSDLKDVFGG
jgi:hypothetical protein